MKKFFILKILCIAFMVSFLTVSASCSTSFAGPNHTHDWDYIAGPFEGDTYFLKCLSCGAEATDVHGTIIEGDHTYA